MAGRPVLLAVQMNKGASASRQDCNPMVGERAVKPALHQVRDIDQDPRAPVRVRYEKLVYDGCGVKPRGCGEGQGVLGPWLRYSMNVDSGSWFLNLPYIEPQGRRVDVAAGGRAQDRKIELHEATALFGVMASNLNIHSPTIVFVGPVLLDEDVVYHIQRIGMHGCRQQKKKSRQGQPRPRQPRNPNR